MSGAPNKRPHPPVRGSSVQPQTTRPSLSHYQQQSHDFQHHSQRTPTTTPNNTTNPTSLMNRSMTGFNPNNPNTPNSLPPGSHHQPSTIPSGFGHGSHQRVLHNSPSVNSQQAQMIAQFANSKHKFSSFNSLSSMYDQPNLPLNVNSIRNLYLYNAASTGGGAGGNGSYLRQQSQSPNSQQQLMTATNLPHNILATSNLVPMVLLFFRFFNVWKYKFKKIL